MQISCSQSPSFSSFRFGLRLPGRSYTSPLVLCHLSFRPITASTWSRLEQYSLVSKAETGMRPETWSCTNNQLAMCVGSFLSTIIGVYQERIANHYGKLSPTPEGRLYISCVQSALLPIGLFWFSWTLMPSVHWIVPAMAIGCATMGLFSIYLAVFNYLADTYHRYASSALAAQSFCASNETP